MAQVTRIQDFQDTRKKESARKTKSGKTLSPHAAAAKLIRQDLKKAWPTVKFSVTSSSFAGGDSVDINWEDGPSVPEVDAVAKKYQYGHFDGMFDIYEYSNGRQDIPQAKYVQAQRKTSADRRREAVAWLNKVRGWTLVCKTDSPWAEVDPASDFHTGNGWASHEVHRVMYAQSFVCPACHTDAAIGDRFCGDCGHEIEHDHTYVI